MIIFGIDCAVENLGLCIVSFDELWREKVISIIDNLNNLYENINSFTKEEFINEAYKIVTNATDIVDNILSIKWFNVIDLIPGNSLNEVSVLDRTRRLKSMLVAMDNQFDKPDLVLIEYQMGPNDVARMISSQIAYHYTDYTDINIIAKTIDYRKERKKKNGDTIAIPINTITYAVSHFPLGNTTDKTTDKLIDKTTSKTTGKSIDKTTSKTTGKSIDKIPEISLVNPALKNKYFIAPDGSYENFIVKLSNYTANKKHCIHNFHYYVKTMMKNGGDILDNVTNKADDMSDAFMMIFAYLKKNNML